MRHRIFIAINLLEEIKRSLEEYQKRVDELFTPYRNEVSGGGPIRWVKPENLHITLVFLGYISDEELLEVIKVTKEVAQKHNSFSLNLNKICYGPPKKMPPRSTSLSGSFHRSPCSSIKGRVPRMVWVMGEKSEKLADLKEDLESAFLEKVHFSQERRAFSPHITLGRIRGWEWRRIEPEERPRVDEEINLGFTVNSIEVMESELKRGGAEYTILESCPLKS